MDAGLTMSDYRSFDSIAPGDVFPPEPLEFVVSDEVVDRFLSATANDGASYARSDGQGTRSFDDSGRVSDQAPLGPQKPARRYSCQADAEIPSCCPARGRLLTVQGRFVDKYIRKDRPYVVADFEARGSDGSLVSSGRVTSIWGRSP